LIEALERRKRGLMQQLLTGKRRLKAYGQTHWHWVRIGELLKEVCRPIGFSDDAHYRLISIRRRSGGPFLREVKPGHEIATKVLLEAKAGDFLISRMQVVHGAMAMNTPELDGAQISGTYIALVARDPGALCMPFFDWLSRMPRMYRLALLSSYGVHIEKMTFNLDLFMREKVFVPSTAKEQQDIVDVLGESEVEIGIQHKRLASLHRQKQGLMQVLLTGKVRVGEADHVLG